MVLVFLLEEVGVIFYTLLSKRNLSSYLPGGAFSENALAVQLLKHGDNNNDDPSFLQTRNSMLLVAAPSDLCH